MILSDGTDKARRASPTLRIAPAVHSNGNTGAVMNGKTLQSTLGFVSGVLIGLSIITPVFGATSPAMEAWNGLLTLLAVVLLFVGFGLYATRAARERELVRMEPQSRID